MKDINFARLNHILIPKTYEDRERFRQGRAGRLSKPFTWIFDSLTDEGRVLVLLILPFLSIASLQVTRTQVYMFWSALCAVLIAGLACRRLWRLRGVSIEVHAPRRVAVGEPVTFSVTMRNTSPRDYYNIKVRGPFLPWDGKWHPSPGFLAELKQDHAETVVLKASFIERGEHYLDRFGAVPVVPMGLIAGPGVKTAGCRFLVVPRIAPVVSMSLPTHARFDFGLMERAARAGESMELLGVRPFRTGDSVRDIHMRTWARKGVPHVKEYQNQGLVRVAIFLDTRQDGWTEANFEAAVSLVAGMTAYCAEHDVLVDSIATSEETFGLTEGREQGYLDRALEFLASVSRTEADADAQLERLESGLVGLSALYLVGPAESALAAQLSEAARRRDVQTHWFRVVSEREETQSDERPYQDVFCEDIEAPDGALTL